MNKVINITSNGIKQAIDDLVNENDKLQEEIERLNKQIEEYQKALDETTSEKIDIENIIKEVREYIETHLDNTFKTEFDYITTNPQELLEILDKDKQ